jgi:Flp pilus assembly protein TadB
MTPLVAVLGAAVAACLAGAVIAAFYGLEPPAPKPPPDPYAPATPSRWDRFSLRLGLGFAAGLAIAALTRWPVATAMAGVGGFLAPSLIGAKAARLRAQARTEGIGAWTEQLRDVMAAGGALEQSIAATAEVAPIAIRAEVVRLAARLERQRLPVALRAFSAELADPVGDLVTAALLLSAERTPKKLGELLSSLAKTARELVTMRLRVETGRARTRSSVRIILGVTMGFSTLLVLLNPTYVSAYNSVTGQIVLVFVAVLYIGAYRWVAMTGREEPTERFLIGLGTADSGASAPDPGGSW